MLQAFQQWWDSLSGPVHAAFGWLHWLIYNLLRLIDGGISHAWSWIVKAWDWLTGVADSLARLWSQVYTFISQTVPGWFDAAYQWVHRLVDGVVAAVGRWFADLREWVLHGIQDVKNFFSRLLTDIREWVLQGIQDVKNFFTRVWDDVREWVLRGIQDVKNFAVRLWHDFYNDVWAPIKRLWDRYIAPWIPVLERFGASLLRFLSNPIGFVMDVLEGIVSHGARYFLGLIVSGLTAEGDFVEGFLARWLSL